MIRRNLGAVFVMTALAGCATKSESFMREGTDFKQYRKVAVIEFTGAEKAGKAYNIEATDLMGLELLKKGFDVVERGQVENILKEQGFQTSALADNAQVGRLGGILGVNAIVTGTLQLKEEKGSWDVAMTVKMIDVKQGTLLWMGNVGTQSGKSMSFVGGSLARAVANDPHEALRAGITAVSKDLPKP